jgi:diacylglycerol kinase
MGRNARIQAVVAVAVVIAGVWTGLSSGEWMTLVLCCGLVLAAEAFNTALEELANEVTEERRPRIRRAKDMAAGAVLITAMTAAIVGCVIFLPKWF